MTAGDALTLGLSPDAPPGDDLRPGGVAPPPVVVEDAPAIDAAIEAATGPAVTPEPPARTPANPFEAMVRAIEAVREELAGRDGELRDALVRIARLYERLAAGREAPASAAVASRVDAPALAASPPPAPSGADEDALRTLLRSIDTLATVTEASITRASDLSRSMQHLVEAVQGLTNRVDSLVGRTDTADVRLESIAHTVDALSEQVTMLGRRLSAPAPPPRPKLRAIGRDDAGPSA